MSLQALVAAGAGFLLAVVWFDLMFDVQALRRPGTDDAVESIATYYRRVTTDARPMNLLVALVMLVTVGGVVAQLAGDATPTWVAAASLVLIVVPVVLARVRTVPNAVRLGARRDDVAQRRALAASIGGDHVVVATALAVLVVLQVAAA